MQAVFPSTQDDQDDDNSDEATVFDAATLEDYANSDEARNARQLKL